MPIKIREAARDDYDCIHHIQKQVHEIHCKGKPDQYRMAQVSLDKQYFEGLIDDENSKVFLVIKDGDIVAYTVVNIKEPVQRPILVPKMVLFVNDFGVDRSCRRKGIGKFLFDHIISFSKKIGADSVELVVWEFNVDAIEFYAEMGMSSITRRMEITL